ncbi:hypothetical protein RVS70_05690 [Virgibacillus sp. M23]|uniref:hypothetical protein n=1 Tax=Virgibacillus sp. M23 TaxID=3079030 RepID=UPI002A91FE65|nr:hypothetical protein [Virgibacillus sp. M23]MDY7043693.1 hypothetical protein [Virgibacillus sp. M23]
MGIDIKNVGLTGEDRHIREIINTPSGNIEIYEPTVDDISKIIDLQRDMGFEFQEASVSFDGLTVVKELFPLLTNIDMGDLPDEELNSIIDNPTVHLLITQQIIAQIIAEANKVYSHRIKTELLNSESTMAQAELINSIPAMIMDRAKRDGKTKELVDKVSQLSDEYDSLLNKSQEDSADKDDAKI